MCTVFDVNSLSRFPFWVETDQQTDRQSHTRPNWSFYPRLGNCLRWLILYVYDVQNKIPYVLCQARTWNLSSAEIARQARAVGCRRSTKPHISPYSTAFHMILRSESAVANTSTYNSIQCSFINRLDITQAYHVPNSTFLLHYVITNHQRYCRADRQTDRQTDVILVAWVRHAMLHSSISR